MKKNVKVINEESLNQIEQQLEALDILSDSMNNIAFGYGRLRELNPELADYVGLTIGSGVLNLIAESMIAKRDREYVLEDII